MITRRKGLTLTGAALASGAAFGLGGCGEKSTPVKAMRSTVADNRLSLNTWEGEALGAPASIKLYVADNKTYANYGIYASDEEIDDIYQGAQAEIARLEKIFSLYDPNSEISRLNQDGALENASPELLDVLRTANIVSKITNGAFDITVQPLWETAKLLQQSKVTKERERLMWKYAYSLVGYKDVQISGRRISFSAPDMSITLNGIAQGYITDKVQQFLYMAGARSGLVNIGEYKAFGRHKWDIALQDPNNVLDTVDTMALQNQSLATSSPKGGYLDAHLSHIFEPRTGHAKPQFISATVVHARAVMADALATAFTLMDEEAIRRVWRYEGQTIILVREDGEVIKLERPT